MNNFFTELRRRNIFRVAGVYAVVGWILMQVVSVMTPALNLPDWVDSFFAVALLIGFPIALLLAWAFEMTPEGVKPAGAMAEATSAAAKPVRALDYVIVGALVLVGALVIWQGLRTAPFEAAKNEAPQSLSRTGSGDEGAGVVKKDLHPEGSPQAIASKDANTNTDPASIAVLPFADLSPNKDQEYFSDGMAEEILNVLVRVDGMKVASRTSAFGFKGQEALGIPAIAQKLNVRHVLEGSVRKSGDTLRITAQLIDAQTDQHLWSEAYDRKLTAENIFAIQDEIANEIVKQLGVKIGGDLQGTAQVKVAAGTENLDAYELFLRAHNKFLTRNDIPGTIALYERTVAADPGFARAWAGLAAAYTVAPSWGGQDRDYNALAINSANKAIALNPDLALPYAVLGNRATDKSPPDYEQAFAQIGEAIKRDPKETTAWLWRGITNNAVGYFAKAEQDFAQCLALDPAYENCRRHMAVSALFAGDTKRALKLFEQGRINGARSLDDTFLGAYAAMGNLSTVLMSVYTYNMSGGNGDYAPLVALDYRAVTEPDFNFEVERAAIEAVYEHAAGKPLDWTSTRRQYLAFQYRNYAAVKNPDTSWQVWWYPYPAALKASPHQKRWMVELGLPEFWRKNGFPPQCKPVGDDDFVCD
jgi:TolB-like protein